MERGNPTGRIARQKIRGSMRRARKVSVARAPWEREGDLGADGPAARAEDSVVESAAEVETMPDGSIERRNPNGRHRRRKLDVLERYHRDGRISTRGYNAGVTLREAWLATERGQVAAEVRERVDTSARPDRVIDIRIDTMSRYLQVADKVPREHAALL